MSITTNGQADTPKHDAQGARLESGGRRLHYDAFDRLVQVDRTTDNGVTWPTVATYTYAPDGRRLTKTTPTEQTAFVSDGDTIMTADAARSGDHCTASTAKRTEAEPSPTAGSIPCSVIAQANTATPAAMNNALANGAERCASGTVAIAAGKG